MKYKVILIAEKDIKTEIFDDEEMPIADFEKAMVEKHGDFFTYSCNPISEPVKA